MVNLVAHVPGIAANIAEDEKDANHGSAVRAQGSVFIPLAWGVCGHRGDLSIASFEKIARYATSNRRRGRCVRGFLDAPPLHRRSQDDGLAYAPPPRPRPPFRLRRPSLPQR